MYSKPWGLISRSNMLGYVDSEGRFTTEVAGDATSRGLIGKEVLSNGSKGVVDLLRNVGPLLKVQRVKHRSGKQTRPSSSRRLSRRILSTTFIIP